MERADGHAGKEIKITWIRASMLDHKIVHECVYKHVIGTHESVGIDGIDFWYEVLPYRYRSE